MTWLSLATGFVGGAAALVIGVPLTLWFVISYLDEEFAELRTSIQSLRPPPAAPKPDARYPAAGPPSQGPSYWPPDPGSRSPGWMRGSEGGPREIYPRPDGLRGYDPFNP